MTMDSGKWLRRWLRKTHRWLALPFAALIPVMLVVHDSPFGKLFQQSQQILLLVMALTGVYLFLLPWWTKWRRSSAGDTDGRTRPGTSTEPQASRRLIP